MKNRLLKLGTILTMVLLPINFLYSGNTSNLIGTYRILPRELRELSPITGAIVYNEQVLKRLYDHGHFSPGEPKDSTKANFNQQLQTWLKSIEAISITKIIRQLFYRIPGTTGKADFNPSKTITETPKQLVKKIAHNLANLSLYKALEPELEGKNHKQRKDRLKKELQLKKIGKATGEDFYKALQDPIFAGEKIIQDALLGLLWIKINHDRKLLGEYFKQLHGAFNEGIQKLEKLLIQTKKSKKKNSLPFPAIGLPYEKEQQEAIFQFKKRIETLKKIIEQLNPESFDPTATFSLNDINQLHNKTTKEIVHNKNLSEIVVYASITPQKNPPAIPWGEDLDFSIPNKGDIQHLRPCFEASLRNLINYFAFDAENHKYSTKVLEKRIGRKVHPDLAKFYNTHKDPAKSLDYNVQLAWAKIVTDLDNIAYLVTAESQQKEAFSYESLNRPCHIRLQGNVTDAQKKELASLDLNIPDKKTYTHYELQATFRNFILLFDHLLQLKLFANKNFAEELLRKDFISTYLPKVLKILGAEDIKTTFTHKCKEIENRKDTGNLEFFLPKFQILANFELNQGHGSFNVTHLESKGLEKLNNLTNEEINIFPPIINLIKIDKFEKALKNGKVDLISYFSQKDVDERALTEFAKKHLTTAWLKLIEYKELQDQEPFHPSNKEVILKTALLKELPEAKEKARKFLLQNPSDMYFPCELWSTFLQTDPTLKNKAFDLACKNTEKSINPYYKQSAFNFLVQTFLGQNNTIGKRTDEFLQQTLSQTTNKGEINNKHRTYISILYPITVRIKETKNLTFNEVKHLFDSAITKTTESSILDTIFYYLTDLLESKSITPQEAATFVCSTKVAKKNLVLDFLTKCMKQGLSTQDTARHLRTITYREEKNPRDIKEDFFLKYYSLAKKLLQKDTALTWDTSFWETIKKEREWEFYKNDLLLIKQKRTLIRAALLYIQKLGSAYFKKTTTAPILEKK